MRINPITPDGVSQRHTLHLIASHFYMNEENEVSFHEFLSWTILYPLKNNSFNIFEIFLKNGNPNILGHPQFWSKNGQIWLRA